MKKNFTTFFIAMMLVVLSGCGEDIEVPNNSNDDKIDPTAETMTVFSSSSNGTRTSMDTNAKFYWEAGDYIWVDTLKNGSFTGKSHSIELSNPTQAPSAKFYFRQIVLTEPKYDLTYTGNNSSKGTEVTIAAEQTQSGWNSPAHLGESGDCGVAEAIRDNSTGTYSFSLKHKAAYLIFQPYKNSVVDDNWKLTGIEITADGTSIAGTYPFSMSGLDTNNVTDPSSTITLSWNEEYLLNTSASEAFFVVMQPGTHTLTIKYTVKPSVRVNGVTGATFNIIKTINSRDYKVNGVTHIKHELSAESYPTDLYYMWDATTPYYHPSDRPHVIGGASTNYATSSTSNRWYNTGSGQASNSCKNLPNVNAITWYVMRGDPRYENNMPWCLDGNYAHIHTIGAWFLKWEYITGPSKLNSGDLLADFKNSTATAPGNDGQQHNGLTTTLNETYRYSSADYKTKGRPAPSEIDKYFFLPAMSHAAEGKLGESLTDIHGCYWTSSSVPSNADGPQAYRMGFTSQYVDMIRDSRAHGRPAAPIGWFQ